MNKYQKLIFWLLAAILVLIFGFLTVKVEVFYAEGYAYKTVNPEVFGLREEGELQTFVLTFESLGDRFYFGNRFQLGDYVRTLRLDFYSRIYLIRFLNLELAYGQDKPQVIDASAHEWALAEVIQQNGSWCPAFSFDAAGSSFDLTFANNEKITVKIAKPGTAYIDLEPEILEYSASLSRLMNHYELTEGQFLTIILEDGSDIELFVCGNRIYSDWAKG